MFNRGIPTKHRGRQFRSRLEARWGRFFDLLGWDYEYEPFDLKGWIPDFLLTRADVLVEIKPISGFDPQVGAKVARAQREVETPREILLLGCTIPFQELRASTEYGALDQTESSEGCPFGALWSMPPVWRPDLSPCWGTAYLSPFEMVDHEGTATELGWDFFSQLDPVLHPDRGFRFGANEMYRFAQGRINHLGKPIDWGAWYPCHEVVENQDLVYRGMTGPALQLWADAGNRTQWMAPR